MDEVEKIIAQWTMGFGDAHKTLSGSATPAQPVHRALKSDWKTRRMPCANATFKLGIPLADKEFELLAWGHIPEAMEDHWFMYFDGASFNFHRSWTGICIYQARVVRHDNGYVITDATVNRNAEQYGETSDQRDALLLTILFGQALGRDVSALWQAYHQGKKQGARGSSGHDAVVPQPTVIGFRHEDGPFGCLSNWYPRGFEFRGIRYPTAEHWIMWQKAQVLGDTAAAQAVLAATTPAEARVIGRHAAPYDGKIWEAVREHLAYVGVREKCLQNLAIAERLLATGSAVLTEAAEDDLTWGIGFKENDPLHKDVAQWKGSNLLGRICMRVRGDLRLASQADIAAADLARGSSDVVEYVCKSPIGQMSLLELSRVPAARPAVNCYAKIACYHQSNKDESLDALLIRSAPTSIAQLEATHDGLDVVGWYELLAQLAFLHAVGLL